jgi:NAD-specific glutamate dehydrogenase
MNADRIEQLIKQADETAGGPRFVSVDTSAIRRRGYRRQLVRRVAPVTSAAVVLVAATIWVLCVRRGPIPSQQEIASLQTQVAQLSARTDAALNLVREVIEKERRQQELEALEAKLAEFSDPLEETRKQVDKTAFILVYQADQMYRQLNKAAAIESYKQVIKLFPDNHWAQVAQQRLSEIENKKSNETNSEGALLWKPQSA